MPQREKLPATASQATDIGMKKLYSDSASRNAPYISEVLSEYLPDKGKVLELASGTGQHCIYFSEKFSDLEWQPSDIDKKHFVKKSKEYSSIKWPLLIDATVEKWDTQINNYDAIIAINILHLISFKEMKSLIRGSSSALNSNGYLIFYGPFMRGSELTSDEDIKFHSSLVACDPEIGYKDDFDILDEIEANNLCPEAVIEMPANNLMFIAKK